MLKKCTSDVIVVAKELSSQFFMLLACFGGDFLPASYNVDPGNLKHPVI